MSLYAPFEALAASEQSLLLQGAYRTDKNSWIYVHLEGTPQQIGYQNGWLLYDSIDQNIRTTIGMYWTSDHSAAGKLGDQWHIARDISRIYIWPKLTMDMQAEMEGIAKGVKARGLKWDLWDILASNSWGDIGVYMNLYTASVQSGAVNHQSDYLPGPSLDDRCSAFIATGSYTKGGEVVMAHSTWTDYAGGECGNVIYDITPSTGHRFVMQSTGGSIWSGPDWLYNDAGLMVTETTIPDMSTYNPNGLPVFVRERLAIQYGGSIDDFLFFMMDHNTGAYANEWLVGDAKTGEICSLQLGCNQYDLKRSFNDMIVSTNFPKGPNILKETTYDFSNKLTVPYWRMQRALDIRSDVAHKGLVDIAFAEKFEADTYDMYLKKFAPTMRDLCGIGESELNAPPVTLWDGTPITGPYPSGACDAKVTSSSLVMKNMGMYGRFGHGNGMVFNAADFLKKHPEFAWQKPYLHDMPNNGVPVPWTFFS
jgi:hypothetical protein